MVLHTARHFPHAGRVISRVGVTRSMEHLPSLGYLLRDLLVPLNRRYPINSVIDAAREYATIKGRRVTFEYACIAGVNDHPEQAEALAAFGRADLYIEQLVLRARHIEVQVMGDGTGAVSHAWERDCTVQRNHQKLVEIAPAPNLGSAIEEHSFIERPRVFQAFLM